MKMSLHSHANKTNFHEKDYASGLAWTKRLKATQKWPILKRKWDSDFNFKYRNKSYLYLSFKYIYIKSAMLCNSYLLTTCKKLCKSKQIICKNVPYNLGNRYIHAVIRTCVGNVFNKTSILLSHMLPARIYIVKKQP